MIPLPPPVIRAARPGTLAASLVWGACLVDWMWLQKLPGWVTLVGCIQAAVVAILWLLWAYQERKTQTVTAAAVASVAYVPLWHFAVVVADAVSLAGLRANLAWWGTLTFYCLGLLWVIWGLERASHYYERRRRLAATPVSVDQMVAAASSASIAVAAPSVRVHNPLDPEAWFYGRKSKKLNQSLTAFSLYSFAFLIAFYLATNVGGCEEIYELPAGGGQAKASVAQTVRVEKVIKKKFVVNPFAAISFKVPPIDEVKLQIEEATAHQYAVGYGAGTGAGFSGGTKSGKVRFIRLEYQGGDWDQEFATVASPDQLMLMEYGLRTKQKVYEQAESRPIAQLKNFPIGKSPPFVYMTGQRNIQLSPAEIKILRDYILEKHGMLFADNGGSGHWHGQFFAMMKQVLPNVQPTVVPLDDVIHRTPFQIPFLPYVAPHGGKDAYGWRVDGRLVCYYHPGDIGDAWSDDHSGVSREVWEACYSLGANVIFYAHAEYAKWLEARLQK